MSTKGTSEGGREDIRSRFMSGPSLGALFNNSMGCDGSVSNSSFEGVIDEGTPR